MEVGAHQTICLHGDKQWSNIAMQRMPKFANQGTRGWAIKRTYTEISRDKIVDNKYWLANLVTASFKGQSKIIQSFLIPRMRERVDKMMGTSII